MSESKPDEEKPDCDPVRMAALVGKQMLIGITYRDENENALELQQMFGTVTSAGPQGIRVELEGKRKGEVLNLPPDLRPVVEADPGVYTLRSTNETVIDPDYLVTWSVIRPPSKN